MNVNVCLSCRHSFFSPFILNHWALTRHQTYHTLLKSRRPSRLANTRNKRISKMFVPTAVTIALAFLLGANTAIAAPSELLKRSGITPNTQDCHAQDQIRSEVDYTINIGVNYNQGLCDQAYQKVSTAIVISDWECKEHSRLDSNDHSTWLYFHGTFPVNSDHLNAALHESFPSVNGFNCPGY